MRHHNTSHAAPLGRDRVKREVGLHRGPTLAPCRRSRRWAPRHRRRCPPTAQARGRSPQPTLHHGVRPVGVSNRRRTQSPTPTTEPAASSRRAMPPYHRLMVHSPTPRSTSSVLATTTAYRQTWTDPRRTPQQMAHLHPPPTLQSAAAAPPARTCSPPRRRHAPRPMTTVWPPACRARGWLGLARPVGPSSRLEASAELPTRRQCSTTSFTPAATVYALAEALPSQDRKKKHQQHHIRTSPREESHAQSSLSDARLA